MASVDIPMEFERFARIPRHPDWRWEYWDDALHLSHRPQSLDLVRPTDVAVEAVEPHDVRELDPAADRGAVEAFLRAFWLEEEPYAVYEPEDGARYLDDALARSFERLAVPAGAVAVHGEEVIGVVLLERPYGHEEPAAPRLTWLSVRFGHRVNGIGRALLAVVVARLRAEGVPVLASGASPANRASLLWHWRNGFSARSDPLARMRHGAAPPSRGGG